MTPRPLLLCLLLGCASSAEPPAAPQPPAPEPPAPEQAAPVQAAPVQPVASNTQDPCDKLDPQVFDATDIDARTDLSDAQKEQAKREQAERRRVLFECFQRAMKEKQQLEQQPQPQDTNPSP